MAWYKEWFGQEYLELYAHRDAGEAARHVDFVERHLAPRLPAPAAVLDLACGAGRHTKELRRRGYRALGTDLSVTLLAHSPRVPNAAGNMRQLPFRHQSFDWLLNFFTSFGYFERERENFRVLEEIERVLRPGGRYLIDFLNRETVIAGLKPSEVQEIAGRKVYIERWFDETTQRINKRMRLEEPGKASQTYIESVRAYSHDEVTIGARWAGLEVDDLYGNFQGVPFNRDSERLILVGHRPA